MKPIAIVSAMHDELSQLLDLIPDEHKQNRAGREFWLGHLCPTAVTLTMFRYVTLTMNEINSFYG